jgi:transposase
MEDANIVGLDLAKRIFQVHGAGFDGRVVCRKKLSRGQLRAFFAQLPPAYVKPFVKRQKNDAADAEAIAEAASRPTMRFVEPKTSQPRSSRRPKASTASTASTSRRSRS